MFCMPVSCRKVSRWEITSSQPATWPSPSISAWARSPMSGAMWDHHREDSCSTPARAAAGPVGATA